MLLHVSPCRAPPHTADKGRGGGRWDAREGEGATMMGGKGRGGRDEREGKGGRQEERGAMLLCERSVEGERM